MLLKISSTTMTHINKNWLTLGANSSNMKLAVAMFLAMLPLILWALLEARDQANKKKKR
jgi:inner membrane protein involved in colicin E2 resistance